jgi:hypothetical protein
MFFHSPHCINIFHQNEKFIFTLANEQGWFLCAKNRKWCEKLTHGTMNQCSICLYLDRKCISDQVIHDEFVQILGFDALIYSTVTFYLCVSRCRPQNAERHSDPLRRLSTTQFSKPLMKPRLCQCTNQQSPRAFYVQQFDDAWQGLWDSLSSIYTESPTPSQMHNDKFESIN